MPVLGRGGSSPPPDTVDKPAGGYGETSPRPPVFRSRGDRPQPYAVLFDPVGQKLIIVHESSSISAFTSMTNGAGKRDRAASGHFSPPPYVTAAEQDPAATTGRTWERRAAWIARAEIREESTMRAIEVGRHPRPRFLPCNLHHHSRFRPRAGSSRPERLPHPHNARAGPHPRRTHRLVHRPRPHLPRHSPPRRWASRKPPISHPHSTPRSPATAA